MGQHSTASTGDLTTEDVPDEILRSIHIDATAETVFAVISEPGWFINDGRYREHEITTEGDVSRVVDPVHGEFSIRTVALDPPRRAVFRWLGGVVGEFEEFPENTVEFTVEAAADGADGVELTVRETGFASLSSDAAVRRERFEDNTQGWIEELGVAKARAEAA